MLFKIGTNATSSSLVVAGFCVSLLDDTARQALIEQAAEALGDYNDNDNDDHGQNNVDESSASTAARIVTSEDFPRAFFVRASKSFGISIAQVRLFVCLFFSFRLLIIFFSIYLLYIVDIFCFLLFCCFYITVDRFRVI